MFRRLWPWLLVLSLSPAAAGSGSLPGCVEPSEEELARFSELPSYPQGLVEIAAFRVEVSGPDEEARRWGLTERVIRNTVEPRLEGAGIRVVKANAKPNGEGAGDGRTATLYVDVSAGEVSQLQAFVVGLTVSVDRQVLLLPRGYPVEAQVWDAGYTGIVQTRDLVETVTENLRLYLDDLLNEYSIANPEAGPEEEGETAESD